MLLANLQTFASKLKIWHDESIWKKRKTSPTPGTKHRVRILHLKTSFCKFYKKKNISFKGIIIKRQASERSSCVHNFSGVKLPTAVIRVFLMFQDRKQQRPKLETKSGMSPSHTHRRREPFTLTHLHGFPSLSQPGTAQYKVALESAFKFSAFN